MLAIGLAACSSPAPQPPPRPVDLLLVTVDTLRADALGSYGNRTAATPWIDKLAAGGVRFDRAHAQNVVTLPSHANILAGRYPFAHGVRDNAGFRFPQTIETLATLLKARGYRTGAFVSAFPLDSRFGLGRGFDEYDDRLGGSARPAFLEQERAGTETVARARAWLARESGRPSLCWVHIYEPHFPYAAPEPFASRFSDNPYAGEVAAADSALGPLLQPLLDAGRSGRTLVVFTADHGESLGDHGEATHGVFAYESTLRVPLILYSPGTLPPAVDQRPARHVDILPTILDVLSIPIPPGLDGVSLTARSAAGTDANRTYFEALSGALNRGWAPVRGAVDRGLKYIDLPIPELYDLAGDPKEEHNLVDGRPDDARRLKAFVAQFPNDRPQAAAEDDATADRLRSLGYVSGGGALRARYTEADDPKRLIGIDRDLQAIVGLYLQGKGAAALTAARALAEAHPKMPIAWLHLAHLERENGDLTRAVAALEHAHALNPSNAETAALLGGYLTQAGRAGEAVAVLTPFAARRDADVDLLTTLAQARARLGAVDEALALLRRARDQAPHNAQPLIHEGTVLLMAGRKAEAQAAFEQALARDPSSARAQSSLAAIAVQDGRIDEAMRRWREAVARDPAEFAPIFSLGVAFARGGQLAQARACLEFFAEHAPSDRYGPQIAQARTWLSR